MELLYLWANEFKCLKQKAICFSSRFTFQTELADKELTVAIKYNPEYVPSLLKEPVTSIAAIIGDNGSGKSTCLELVKKCLSEGEGGTWNSVFIVLYDQSTKTLSAYHTFNLFRIRVTWPDGINHTEPIVIKQKTLRRVDLPIDPESEFPLSHQLNIIHYANDFNPLDEGQIEVAGLYNITTNFLMHADRRNVANDFDNESLDALDGHQQNEMLRNLLFICSSYAYLAPFPMPPTLAITVTGIDFDYFMGADDLSGNLGLYKDVVRKLYDDSKGFLDRLAISALCNHLRFQVTNAFSPYPFKDRLAYFSDQAGDTFERVTQWFNSVIQRSTTIILNNEKVQIDNKKERTILAFLTYAKQLCEGGIIESQKEGPINQGLIKTTESGNRTVLAQFTSLYYASVGGSRYLHFSWTNLSTGEQSRLTLFSRIYDVVDRLKLTDGERKQNVLLLLDEPDSGFHPEWQQSLISDLITLVTGIFAKKTVQIVITANAPFLTSDLPRTSINFIKTVKDGYKIIERKQFYPLEMEQTFGANIHTLLSNGYYLKRTIGQYACTIIDEIIGELTTKDKLLNSQDLERIRATIKIIGEPIIQRKLAMMLDEKIIKSKNIDLLEKRLQELKGDK